MNQSDLPSFRVLARRVRSIFLSALGLAVFALAVPGDAAAKPRFGLWVEAEGQNQPFRSQSDFVDFLKFAADWQFTDLYCQVFRGGRSWYPSMFTDDQPFRIAEQDGFDPLGDTIRQAHARGQKVHAWVNALRINDNTEAPLFQVAGRNAALMDSYGNSTLDYDAEGLPPGASASNANGYRLGTPGIWLDASDPQVRRFLVETIREIILRYPTIDGIHLDMIRFPHAIGGSTKAMPARPEFGYSSDTIRRYFTSAGRQPPDQITPALVRSLESSEAWRSWKRAQVTLLVFEVRELLQQIAPTLELSAAVVAEPERAYGHAFQDWTRWANRGLVDTVMPMNYVKEVGTFATRNAYALRSVAPERVVMGLGAWLLVHSPMQMVRQAQLALDGNAAGVVLFSYSNLFSKTGRNAVTQFEAELFRDTSLTSGN